MKSSVHLPNYRLIFGFLMMAFVSQLQAALIPNLSNDYVPDTASFGIDFTYALGGTETGGYQMNMNGFIDAIDDGAGLTTPIFGACGLGCYSVIANFDSSGNFANGTIDLTYTGTYNLPGGKTLDSGTLVSNDLQAFGFQSVPSGNNGQNGLFQFSFWNADGSVLGGDYGTLWGATSGGTEININNLIDDGTGNPLSLATGETWDSYGLMTTSFSGSGAFSDTFVPIPAAVWLFGSGLLSLGALARRRKVAGTGA